MTWMAVRAAVVALLLVGAPAVSAQSLADIARQEEARRQSIGTPGKVYTNDSLRSEPPPTAAVPAAPAPPAASAPAPAPGAQAPQVTPAPEAGAAPAGQSPAAPAPQTEAEWRKRITSERDALSRAQTFADALQSQVNALNTDFVNRDDPIQRAAVAAALQKALAELDRVKQEIQQHQKAITGIQDDARRAGVPAGWVR